MTAAPGVTVFCFYNQDDFSEFGLGHRSVLQVLQTERTVTLVDWTTLEEAKTSVAKWDAIKKESKNYTKGVVLNGMTERLKFVDKTRAIAEAFALVTGEETDLGGVKGEPAAIKQSAKLEEREMAKAKKEKKQPKAKAAKVSKEPKAKKDTASSLFRELILLGTMTDDQIFAKVKAKYGLSDDKRWYVAWYRNQAKKAGLNPPVALGSDKPAKKEKAGKKAPVKKAKAAKKEPKTKKPKASKPKAAPAAEEVKEAA